MAQLHRGQCFTFYPSFRPFMPFTPPPASHSWLTSVEHPLNATYQMLQKELSVLFGCVSLPWQNKASLVIQSRHSLAPSSEAIPTRRIIIRQGQQLINSNSAVSPLCVLMAPAYVLDAGSATLSSMPPPFSAGPYMLVIWAPAHPSYFSPKSSELSFCGASVHTFRK